MNWISQPLALYSCLAAGLLLGLYLFWTLKTENASLRLHLRREIAEAQDQMEELQGAIRQLHQSASRIGTAVKTSQEAPSTPLPPSQSVNITKRSQALRMHRRGGHAGEIAAALQMPRNEVELLLKVHRIAVEQHAR